MTKRKKGGKGGRGDKRVDDDMALWSVFTQRVDPLDLKGRVADTDSSLLDEMLKREAERLPAPRPADGAPRMKHSASKTPVTRPGSAHASAPARPAPLPNTIDAKEVRRLGRGRKEIDARIDLHGMRQHEAHAALRVFLFRSVAKGHRMVLVITGKGARSYDRAAESGSGPFIYEGQSGQGVLRRSVPLWLGEPDLRVIVVGHTAAHVRHGGDGALYVQLRRNRSHAAR